MGIGSLFGGGTSSQAAPPPVYPINIGATLNAADTAGLNSWQTSLNQYAKQYPGIVQSQNLQMQQAFKQLTGPLDPTLQKSFINNSEGQALSAFGGGSGAPNVTGAGSIGRNTVAAGVANQTQNYQDYVRSNIDQLIGDVPLPQYATGQQAGQLALANLANQVNANRNAAGYSASQDAANAQAQAQGTSTAIGAGSAALGATISALSASGALASL